MKGLMIDLKELHGEVNAPYVETKNSDMNGKRMDLQRTRSGQSSPRKVLPGARFARLFPAAILLLFSLCILTITAVAAPTDKLRDFTITVDVNEDASLNMNYHIEWEVLDSTSEGPLTWVKIGIPNSKYVSMKKLTSNIKKIGYYSASPNMAA